MEVCLLDSLRGPTGNSPPLWSLALARTDPELSQLLFPLSEVYLRASLSSGLRPFVPLTHTNRCPATGLSRRKL